MRLIPCASSYLIRCLFSYYLISNPSQMNIRHGKIPLVCSRRCSERYSARSEYRVVVEVQIFLLSMVISSLAKRRFNFDKLRVQSHKRMMIVHLERWIQAPVLRTPLYICGYAFAASSSALMSVSCKMYVTMYVTMNLSQEPGTRVHAKPPPSTFSLQPFLLHVTI